MQPIKLFFVLGFIGLLHSFLLAQTRLVLSPSVLIVKPQQVTHDARTARYIKRQERLLQQNESLAQESFMQQLRNEYTGTNLLYSAWLSTFSESQQYAIRLMRQHFNYFELELDFASRVVSTYARFFTESYGLTTLDRVYNNTNHHIPPVFLPTRYHLVYAQDSLAALARKYKVQYVLFFPRFEIEKTKNGYSCALQTMVYDVNKHAIVYGNTFYGASRDDKGRALCTESNPTCAVAVAISMSISELVRTFEQNKLPYLVRALWGTRAIAAIDSAYAAFQQSKSNIAHSTGNATLDFIRLSSDYFLINATADKAISIFTKSNLGDTSRVHANVFMGSAANWSVAPPSHIGSITAYVKYQGRWYEEVIESFAIDASNIQQAKANYCYQLNRWGFAESAGRIAPESFWNGPIFRNSTVTERLLLKTVYGLDSSRKIWIIDKARVDSVESKIRLHKKVFLDNVFNPLLQRLQKSNPSYCRGMQWVKDRAMLFANQDSTAIILATQFERKDTRFLYFFVYLRHQPQQLYAWTYNRNSRIFLSNYYNFKITIQNIIKKCGTEPQFERFIEDKLFWEEKVMKWKDDRFAYLQPLIQ